MQNKILREVDNIVSSYEKDQIEIVEGLTFNQHKELKEIEFYSNSRYLNGQRDTLSREKPFYNIVNYRVTVATVATDLDIKDIQVVADDEKNAVKSFIFQKEIFKWMKEHDFAKTLNEMGKTRAKYGGLLVKKCEKDGELDIQVVQWKNAVTDQVDIKNGVIIEKHYLTPVELSERKEAWDNIEDVIEQHRKLKKNDRIEVLEVHGQFTKAILNDALEEEVKDGDDMEFTRQIYHIAKVGNKRFILSSDEEKELPYKYLAWDVVPGRALGKGVVEESKEAQVWTNDSIIAEKNAMELAGKVILKTNSKKVGNNALTDLDNGHIVILEENKDLTTLQLLPSALPQFNNSIERWKDQANNATSTYNANTGEQVPSGTPYSQTALLNQVASKPFDYRREEMGIFLTELFNDWIIPHISKKINREHLLASDYSDEELKIIDESFSTKTANERTIEKIMAGKIVTREEYEAYRQFLKTNLNTKGSRRFLEIPKDYFKDMKAKLTVITTGEQKNKMAILESLNTILVTALKAPNLVSPEFINKVFARILEISGAGISPIFMKSNLVANPTQNEPITEVLPRQAPEGASQGVPTPIS